MPLKTQQDEVPTLNLTPMIDVLFLLIIFFMAGTKFTDWESRLNLKLPQVSQDGALAPCRRSESSTFTRTVALRLTVISSR